MRQSGNPPLRGAAANLFQSNRDPDAAITRGDVAICPEAAGQAMFTDVKREVQQRILGRQHLDVALPRVDGHCTRPQSRCVDRKWAAWPLQPPVHFTSDGALRPTPLLKSQMVMVAVVPIDSIALVGSIS